MSKSLRLVRVEDNGECTLGFLYLDGSIFCRCIERPWKDNQRGISCIPPGSYSVIHHVSPRFGPSLWVTDVPDRSEILIHPANQARELMGCIAPGRTFARWLDGWAVTDSRKTMASLLGALKGIERMVLEVVSVPVRIVSARRLP